MNPHVFQFRFIPVLLIALQAACNPFASPSMGPVQAQGSFKKVAMPKEGFRSFYYRKDNPRKLFLSQKDEYGPGLMLDLDTGAQEWMADRDPDPGGNMVIPGETEEAWLKRQDRNSPIPGETLEAFRQRTADSRPIPIASEELFSCAKWTSVNKSPTQLGAYFIQLKGEYSNVYGLATKGAFFPTGLRKTEVSLFTGDLILSVNGKVLLQQHFKHMPSLPLDMRTLEALDVGLVFYADEHPDGSGDLYIFQVPRHVAEREPEPHMPMLQFNPSAP